MKVNLKKISTIGFEAETESGHTVRMDGSPNDGGENNGIRPMEMVLLGLAGCSGIDVALILKKSRQEVTDCEIAVNASRADSIPAVFTDIHLQYRFTGVQLDPKKIERAIRLSMEKYCSVTRMLEPTVKITHDFDITDA
ncbi:MAG: OsmC family protein [Granulosicoccus sp.]|nr:OsmC family protein [Granulosicoccus sp.]